MQLSKNSLYICIVKQLKQNEKDMSNETMKIRTEKQLTKMGYSVEEAKNLVEKFWNQVSYLKTAREKALYITA